MQLSEPVKRAFRKMLLDKRASLIKETDNLRTVEKEKLQVLSVNALKGDIADTATSPNINLTVLERNEKMIRKYDEALERLEQGQYGVCVDCEEPIPLGRLNVIPFADRCVFCKNEAERQDTIPTYRGLVRVNRLVPVMS